MSKHRLIVCGGRRFTNAALLFMRLNDLHRVHQFRAIMQGGAPGADRLAREWAMTHPEIRRWKCDALWEKYGNAAGPIRNCRMLDWLPDLVVAFEGGFGTADMVRQARERFVEVIEIRG